MLVYLLYMLVFLAKEEQIVSQQVRWRGSKIKFHIIVRKSSLHPFFFFYIFFLPLAGLPSAQSAGPGHFSPLAPAGPLLIPGRPGLRQHPLPPLSAALLRFSISAAAQVGAQRRRAPPPRHRASTQGKMHTGRLFLSQVELLSTNAGLKLCLHRMRFGGSLAGASDEWCICQKTFSVSEQWCHTEEDTNALSSCVCACTLL